jgi:hypothetical protein
MRFTELHKVLGIELRLASDQLWSCRSCLVLKEKKRLQIEHLDERIGTLVEVLADLPKRFPIALTLTGKGIVNKQFKLTEAFTNEKVFQQAFPSAEAKDFYRQVHHEKDFYSIAITRRSLIDELCGKLDNAGFTILSLSIGGLPALQIVNQLNSYDPLVVFDGHRFEFTADRLFVGYSYDADSVARFPLKIGGEPMPERQLMAYAAAFQLLLSQQLEPIVVDVETVNDRLNLFLVDANLKNNAVVFGSVIFFLLLFSFCLFSYYNGLNAKLSQQVGAQVSSSAQTEILKNNVAISEASLKNLDWNGGYNFGKLIDEICAMMPRQLALNKLSMNDFSTGQEKNERIPNIKINGTTQNLTAVNNWIFELKEKQWVKTVKLLKYQDDVNANCYAFSIMITY